MKRILSCLLSLVVIIMTCTSPVASESGAPAEDETELAPTEWYEGKEWDLHTPSPSKNTLDQKDYRGLDDPALLEDVENSVYAEVVKGLDSDEYIVENVSTAYISKEYIEELAYNSQANIFYGYTLEELDSEFQGTRYVFTLDENGETTVVPFEAYDDTYEKVLKNVAIGTGVILICVTVSAVTAGAGAPAVSMIFAASAKSAAVFGASSGALGGVITGTVTGIQTGDWEKAVKAGALAGSESFKWGAITGGISGGATELIALKTAAGGGLTLDEAAIIMKEFKLPANFVKQFHSTDEFLEVLQIAEKAGLTIQDFCNICMITEYPLEVVKLMHSTEESVIYFEQAGLVSETVNGQTALIRTIDLTYESELAGKTVTNLERMQKGYAAIDPVTGQSFELHHIGQSVDSPLAILTKTEHTGAENYSILHDTEIEAGVHSLLSDSEWAAQKREFWKALAMMFE